MINIKLSTEKKTLKKRVNTTIQQTVHRKCKKLCEMLNFVIKKFFFKILSKHMTTMEF